LIILSALSMAEICSAFPSAGSVYFWTAQLAPKKWAPLASYICGWLNFLGNAAGDSSFAFSWAQTLAGIISLSRGYSMDFRAITAVAIGAQTIYSLLNLLRVDMQSYINAFAALLQIGSTITIGVGVLAGAHYHAGGGWVFTDYENYTGLDNSHAGYVIMIGLLTSLWSFAGYEASGHVAEETQGARKAAPRGIISSVVATAVLGFLFMLALLFATPDVASLSNGYFDCSVYNCTEINLWMGSDLGQGPNNTISDSIITNLFVMTLGYKGGLAFSFLLLINLFFAGYASTIVTSRIAFALCRDEAFPGGRYFAKVSKVTFAPVGSVFFSLGY